MQYVVAREPGDPRVAAKAADQSAHQGKSWARSIHSRTMIVSLSSWAVSQHLKQTRKLPGVLRSVVDLSVSIVLAGPLNMLRSVQ